MFKKLNIRLRSCNLFYLITALIAIDQLLKLVFKNCFNGWLYINQNQIFGLELDIPIVIVGVLLFLILIWSIYAKKNIGQALIFSGGLSNLIDRLLWGGVVDLRLPSLIAFNLADLIIIAGVVLVVCLTLID